MKDTLENAAAPAAERAPVAFAGLTKVYRVYAQPRDRLIEAVTGRPRHFPVHALKGVSGTVAKGSVLGLIGENGSGKSTLLKILAGTITPTSGTIDVKGRVASILELGTAFHPEVTGRRNAVLQSALAGLTRAESEAALPEIEAFAELGDFFDRPVKTYSSGMAMRLAFAVATAVLPDIVILDEALAVGDGRFQKKCVDRIFELKGSGRTIVFCSHALYYITTLCDRAIWLRHGELASEGDAHQVVLEYERFLGAAEKAQPAAPAVASHTHGRLMDLDLLDGGGRSARAFRPGEPWALDVEFLSDDPRRLYQVHVAICTRDQLTCFSADSRLDRFGPLSGSPRCRVRISLDALPLAKGEFVVHVFLADEKGLALYDARSDLSFQVESDSWRSGLMEVPLRWQEVPASREDPAHVA